MQEVWGHVVKEAMESDMTQHPMIVSESANVQPKQRERMMEVIVTSQ